MNLAGKRIAVTGAASGIGQETARLMKGQGASIIGIDRNEPSGFVDEYVHIDLCKADSIARAAQQIGDGVDGLCNIAGVPPTAPLSAVLTVNFIGLRHFTECMQHRLREGASIVNMASLAGAGWPESADRVARFITDASFDNCESLSEQLGVDQQRCYFFSKEALLVWTLQNWNRWRDRSIRMNAVSPGPVETPILGDFIQTLGERADEDIAMIGRPGMASEIAPIVAFLCSDESRWINGANIPADGGKYAHLLQQKYGI